MAYTSIYDKILRNPYKITWLDLFSDSLKKHSRQDMEYAMIAGTSMDSATESNMLQKWRKPWLFRAILIGGIAISFIIFAIVYACIQLFEISHIAALNLLFVIVPPIVVPFALMVFFWELNVPRNISIYQLLGYFMVGGMLSILATLIVDIVAPQGAASLAPFSEEPGKLIVAALLIKLFGSNKNRKVYGITGLVIGAAVGAGFGGFESAQYAYNMVDWVQVGGFYIWEEAFEAIVMNEALRGAFAVCGHTLFCAPYAAAVALHMNGNRITKSCFQNRDFLRRFLYRAFYMEHQDGILQCLFCDEAGSHHRHFMVQRPLCAQKMFCTAGCRRGLQPQRQSAAEYEGGGDQRHLCQPRLWDKKHAGIFRNGLRLQSLLSHGYRGNQ